MGNPALNIRSDSDFCGRTAWYRKPSAGPQALSLDDCLDSKNLPCLPHLELEHSATEGTGRAVHGAGCFVAIAAAGHLWPRWCQTVVF